MTVPPVNPPRPGRIIASWSGTAYSTRQAWLISQLTSISEGLSPIRHPGTRLVGDGRPTTELGAAYSRQLGLKMRVMKQLINDNADENDVELTMTTRRCWIPRYRSP